MKNINKAEEVHLIRNFFRYQALVPEILDFISEGLRVDDTNEAMNRFKDVVTVRYNQNVPPGFTNINFKFIKPEEIKKTILKKTDFTFKNSQGKDVISSKDEIHLFSVLLDLDSSQVYDESEDINTPFPKYRYDMEPSSNLNGIICKRVTPIARENCMETNYSHIKKGAFFTALLLQNYSNSDHFNEYNIIEPAFISKKSLFGIKTISVDKDHFSTGSLMFIYSIWEKDDAGNNIIEVVENRNIEEVDRLIKDNDELKNIFLSGDISNMKDKWEAMLKTGKGEIKFSIKGINEK